MADEDVMSQEPEKTDEAKTTSTSSGMGMTMTRRTLVFKGLERVYRLYVPSSIQGKKPPLVLLLHGGGSDGRRLDRFTGFNRIAENEGVILLVPDGVERHWNDGRVSTGYRAHDTNIDDVGFISELIDRVSSEFNVDKDRVYVAGISNGGMMSYRIGLELPEKVAAIAPVVASLPEPLASKTFKDIPVPVVIVNGTDDPLVPWNGGEVTFMRKTLGRVLSTPDTVSFWRKHNHSSATCTTSTLSDNDPSDGIKVLRSEYKGGPDGSGDVVLYAVEGGGHTWHGPRPMVQYLPPARIGRASRDFDATEVIWEFFQKHPRNSSNRGRIEQSDNK